MEGGDGDRKPACTLFGKKGSRKFISSVVIHRDGVKVTGDKIAEMEPGLRVTGHRVTGSAILGGSGRVTIHCVRPGV